MSTGSVSIIEKEKARDAGRASALGRQRKGRERAERNSKAKWRPSIAVDASRSVVEW